MYERDLIYERTTAAMAHKRASGERVGQIPLGYQLAADGIHLSEDAGEQAILGALRTLRSEGLSWQTIAEEMNRRGITTKTGRAWTSQTARKAGAGR